MYAHPEIKKEPTKLIDDKELNNLVVQELIQKIEDTKTFKVFLKKNFFFIFLPLFSILTLIFINHDNYPTLSILSLFSFLFSVTPGIFTLLSYFQQKKRDFGPTEIENIVFKEAKIKKEKEDIKKLSQEGKFENLDKMILWGDIFLKSDYSTELSEYYLNSIKEIREQEYITDDDMNSAISSFESICFNFWFKGKTEYDKRNYINSEKAKNIKNAKKALAENKEKFLMEFLSQNKNK